MRVLNRRVTAWNDEKSQFEHADDIPDDAVYVGRPTIWGNPFVIGKDGNRESVVEMYAVWILDQPELLARLHELKGKDLVCWCAPRACHADVLLRLANESDE